MYQEFILIISVVASFLLGIVVYRRNPSHATHQTLSVLCIANGILATVNYLAVRQIASTHGLLWTRIDMAVGVLHSGSFFMVMHTYPRARLLMSKKGTIFFLCLLGLTAVVAATPLTFSGIRINPNGSVSPTPGLGIILFGVVAIGLFPLGIALLVKKTWLAKGIEKVQLLYLLLGVICTFILILFLQFLNVVIRNDVTLTTLLPLSLIPFVALTTYTIIRHRLMDIRAAIARSLSLSVLIGAVLLIYGVLLIFAVPYIADLTNLRGEIIAAAAALVSIPLARYVQIWLTRLTDRFLFQKQMDYRRALVEVGKELSGTIKIEDVTKTVLKATREIIRSEKTIIFLKRLQGTDFVPVAADGAGEIKVSIPLSHVLIKHLEHTGSPLVKDELALQREQEQKAQHAREIEKVEQTFAWLDIAVVVPLSVNNQFTGLIALGNKLAGTPYMQEDLNFLSALAPQAATALENAQLYKESLEFGEKLKLEVERATHELAVANDQLRDLDKAKSEFLSVASHQLYTPLTPIRGYLSMLLEGEYGPIASQQKPIIKMLETSASRLITLIKNYLDVSRIESGRLELNLESVDLAQMADELVKDMLPNALKKKLKLIFDQPAEAVPHVVADRDRIRQVMMNFIDNAIKYTDKGRVDVHLRLLGQEVLYYVTDTGRGIDRMGLARLFNKFSRVGNSTRLRTEGTGLGLYVAKQIVKEHHGDVEADSEGEGKGSTFTMRLPAEGSPNSPKAGTKASVVIKAAEAAQ